MTRCSYARSFLQKVCVAALLASPVAFGAAAERQQLQAQVLDHAELLCANCFFGASKYYFCFAADNQVLIGYQSTPVLNWWDESKNYLTKFHSGWTAWTPPAQTVPISYDDQHIWVTRSDGKQVKLTRSQSADIFSNNDQCRDAARAKAH